jgi:hypothetical protein
MPPTEAAMQARIVIQLLEKVCEHCPSEEKAWIWLFRTDGERHVDLVIRCKKCGAEMVIPNTQLRAVLRAPESPVNVPISCADEPDPPDEKEKPADPEAERRKQCAPVFHSRAFTPMDRKFLKSLGISTDDIEFEK